MGDEGCLPICVVRMGRGGVGWLGEGGMRCCVKSLAKLMVPVLCGHQ
jgi:hypothetical protein